eukprot:5158275-Pyramimonas_sp.AAC.1
MNVARPIHVTHDGSAHGITIDAVPFLCWVSSRHPPPPPHYSLPPWKEEKRHKHARLAPGADFLHLRQTPLP